MSSINYPGKILIDHASKDSVDAIAWMVMPNPKPRGVALSKREQIAAMAMQGLLANPGGPIQANGMNGWNWCNCTPEEAMSVAVDAADALIAALNKEPTP